MIGAVPMSIDGEGAYAYLFAVVLVQGPEQYRLVRFEHTRPQARKWVDREIHPADRRKYRIRRARVRLFGSV